MISTGYHRQIDYLKTTTPKKIKQMGGGEDVVGKKIPLDGDSGVEVPMNLLKQLMMELNYMKYINTTNHFKQNFQWCFKIKNRN